MPKKLVLKLSSKEKLSNADVNKLIRHMATQLLQKDPRPGEKGITAQWCKKLVALYPQLGEEGENLMEKTVTILNFK